MHRASPEHYCIKMDIVKQYALPPFRRAGVVWYSFINYGNFTPSQSTQLIVGITELYLLPIASRNLFAISA